MKKYMIIALILVMILLPMNVFAEESLEISNWLVDSQLVNNGNLEISEDITFRFNDDFNGVFRNIVEEGTDGISNLQLLQVVNGEEIPYTNDQNADIGDTNVYSMENKGDEIVIMIFSPSNNEEKTFRLKYTILNVATLHQDTGELYYKYLGAGNETPIDYFSANLILPSSNMENVKIFAHGPLNGTINFVDNSYIKMEVSHVPTNTFIEARVLYPKEFTPLSGRIGESSLSSILAEEQSFIEEIEENAARRERNKEALNKVSFGVIGIGAMLVAWFYKLTRRDTDFYENRNLYPDDISPAELNLFMDSTISSRGLMASIFDLARREYLTIDEMQKGSSNFNKRELEKEDFEFVRTNKADGDLLEHERYLLDWLFNSIGNGTSVTTMDIDNFRKKSPIKFSTDQNEWFKLVKEQLKSRDYNDPKSKMPGIIMLVISIPIFILSVINLSFESLWGVVTFVISIMAFVFAINLLTRKSDEGYHQYNLWKDFKKEFENYKDLDIGIPRDKTLIYAVALGLSMKKLNEQRRYYGNDYYPSYWGLWYFSALNRRGGSAFEDRFNNSFYGSTGTSTPNSSSFGGGGGFSGGGGGGAGGGGAGGF